MRTDTKAHKCIELAATGMTTRMIADLLNCHPAYVRVAVRQRRGGGSSDADRRYKSSALGRATMRKRNKERYDAGNRDEARAAQKAAYSTARKAGLSAMDASKKALSAYGNTMLLSGLRNLREARHANS